MRLPLDCPLWVEKFLRTVEDKATSFISSAKTSDEAMKATGAFALWTYIRDEVELEEAKQREALRAQTAKLHERISN